MEVILEGLKVSKPRMAAMLKSSAILEKRSNTPVEKGMWLKCCSFRKVVWLGNDLRIVYKACVSVPDQALVKLSPPPQGEKADRMRSVQRSLLRPLGVKSLTPGLCGHLREAVKEVPMCRVTRERWVVRGGGGGHSLFKKPG